MKVDVVRILSTKKGDNKADFVMELLNNLTFVKAEAISIKKAQFISELKSSVEEVELTKQGKLNLKYAEELLNDL
ncbi:hypothetical protein [Pedobacter mendelii]|uniref:Uncharacterized protein n=1 Tax=Pedobacter mendelii TaxID=1908240 RepID=A0ABQ2BF70_9SPHI|nr:hypothetical protein [Pedobacter mendelii]GGI24122.1 hypothetical protein GCM10008119_11080 [Pedobacter mendelii]